METTEDRLLVDYLGTCNEMLDHLLAEADRAAEVAMAERILANRNIGLLVYDSDPDSPCCHFTVQFAGGRFRLVGKEDKGVGIEWAVRRERMEQIVRDRQEYAKHPDHLDWSCLVSHLGIKAPETAKPNYTRPDESQYCEDLKREYDRLIDALTEVRGSESEPFNSTGLTCLANFVAGVAHEVNNPTGVVRSAADSSQLAVEKIEAALLSGKPIEELLGNQSLKRYLQVLRDDITLTRSATDRIAAIVRSLRTFSGFDPV